MSSPSADVPLLLPAAPLWMSSFYADADYEDLDNIPAVVGLFSPKVRCVLWKFSKELVGEHRAQGGLTSQACCILERYCNALVWKYMSISSSEWEAKKLEVKKRFPLLIAVSLKLASKQESSQNYITGNMLVQAFQSRGKILSLVDINATELDVFTTIKYRVPLWSNEEKVHMLVVELGCSERTRLLVGSVMDLISLQLPLLYERLRIHAIDSPSPDPSPSEAEPSRSPINGEVHIRNLHLLAGVVVATVRYTQPAELDVAPTLAHWFHVSVCYVRWLSNIIFQFLAEQVAEWVRNSVKRSEGEAHGTGPKKHRSN